MPYGTDPWGQTGYGSGYTMADLITDILPRVSKMEKPNGITVFHAANSVLSVLWKRLLERKSDFIVSGEFTATNPLLIPAYGNKVVMPDDFISWAERPRVEELVTDWMVGTVTSYDTATGILVVSITGTNGIQTLSAWNIAVPGYSPNENHNIGTSTDTLTVAPGAQTLTTQKGLDITAGQPITLSATEVPVTVSTRRYHLDPTYLGEDEEHEDLDWWNWYGQYYYDWCIRPRTFKVVGRTMYIRPKPSLDVQIMGRYKQKPGEFSQAGDAIPYGDFFNSLFREGCVYIITKGIAMPDTDPMFKAFAYREIDVIINDRIRMIPKKGRTKRSNFM